MRSRQTLDKLPRIWLMTDERFGEELLSAIAKLPPRSGVIFRHYSLSTHDRRVFFEQVRAVCRRHGHILLLAGSAELARKWGADGFHGAGRALPGQIHSAAVHNGKELKIARRNRADLLLISPVFDTASHPNAAILGIAGFRALATKRGTAKAIALGGINAARARKLGTAAYGWAAIDAFRN